MSTIDRYLARQFCEVYLLCLATLCGLFVVFDAFANLDEFYRQVDSFGELMQVMSEYYAYRVLLFFERVASIVSLIAAMFTVTWIQRHQEMTALLAAGIPTRRILRSVLYTAMVFSLSAAAAREWLIPKYKANLVIESRDLQGVHGNEVHPTYDQKTDVLLQGHASFANEQRIKSPHFILPARLAGQPVSLTAENALYRPPQATRPGGYLLQKVQPADFLKRSTLSLDGQPVVLLADTASWLAPGECFVATDVTFSQLVSGERLRQYSSTRELIAGLRNRSLDFGANVRVLIHARLVQPLLDVILLFLGVPFVVSGERRNVFLAIGICMVITSLFMVVNMGCHWLGAISLASPAFAAWLPVVIFGPAACWLAYPIFR